MAAKTAAQEEFDNIIAKASAADKFDHHPDDLEDYRNDKENGELDEEDEFRNKSIEDTMKMPFFDRAGDSAPLNLPHKDFDNGRTTGVKGVIADARSYEEARRSGGWRNKFSRGNSVTRADNKIGKGNQHYTDESSASSASDDEEFLEKWREQRRLELQMEGNDIRNRRTSPSVRRYGRFDEVDALGYLDAIEKVKKETTVVVFVYDHECPVSQVIETALNPLVTEHPTVHFVRVHYEDIEFDNAGVPAILAYKNQGDLFANLTYIIDQIPEDTLFDTRALKNILVKHQVL